LEPADYQAPLWNGWWNRFSARGLSPADLANFDAALTSSAIRYFSDLHVGVVGPVDGSIALPGKRFDAADFIRSQVVHCGDVKTTAEELEPAFNRYREMLKALQKYAGLARQSAGHEKVVSSVSSPILPAQVLAVVSELRQRLLELGELSPDAQLPNQPDLYDAALVRAVQNFQRTHGLPEDGRLSPDTIKELNVPLVERVSQIKVTLERWRWLPAGLRPPLVVVNVPEFQLRAYSETVPAFTSRVIVGKAYDHRTPLFADEMEYIVFRPYWNVPVSIARDEIIPALRQNPTYLSRHQMEIANSQGTVITESSPETDTLRQLQAGKLEVRQRPGGPNSLGLVKFLFPNQYDVYLHGTPERKLFARSRRDFSHGCVRVEDPEGLAAWMLQKRPFMDASARPVSDEWRPDADSQLAAAHTGCDLLRDRYGWTKAEKSVSIRIFMVSMPRCRALSKPEDPDYQRRTRPTSTWINCSRA
jgi:L,D-transpeptidase YcbB